MSIKSQGGVFGRNPTFNDVTVDGDLSIAGTLTIGGETITGLSYQGGWNASTNTPDIAASSPVTGQFWIVSADGSTDVGGITNWTSGDWALYDGSNWQRVEGGNTDLTTGVQGQLAIANGGTGAADASTARTNLGLGTAATTASTDYATAAQGTTADSALQPADIGVSVQGYDATILTSSDIGSTVQGYDANILTSSDIGSSVQAYDADTAKYDAATAAFTGNLSVDSDTLYVDAAADEVGINTSIPTGSLYIAGPNTSNLGVAAESALNIGAANGSLVGRKVNLGFAIIPQAVNCSASIAFEYTSQSGYGKGDLVFGTRDVTTDTAPTERMRLTSSGNLAFASGNGIDFSATSGTGTSELFDDYEEGTWTPSLTGFTISGTPTFTGQYVKIGKVVYIRLSCTATTSTASTSGTSYVSGLPFTPAQDAACTATASLTGPGAPGAGYIWAGARIYTPTWSATAYEVSVTGFYYV